MAQLSQDCCASGAEILSNEEAVAAITKRFSPVDGVETVALLDADGRVLADDLVATFALPPFTNSAVDGCAVRGQDLPTETSRCSEGRPVRRAPAQSRPSLPAK
jgi:molybdopterin molybdotransferase